MHTVSDMNKSAHRRPANGIYLREEQQAMILVSWIEAFTGSIYFPKRCNYFKNTSRSPDQKCRLPSRFVDDVNHDTWPWSHTCWGHMVLTGPQVCKWVKFYIFRLSYKLTSHDLWPSFVTFDLMNMWKFLHYINKSSLVSIGLNFSNEGNFTFWAFYDLWPWYMTFDHMNIQRVSYCINRPSLLPIRLKLFKWGHLYIFSLSYSLTSDDLWPWYVTLDLINKSGFPSCIYDPTLVEIHQSMWKLEPNINLFSQQTTTTTDNNNNIIIIIIITIIMGQSDPYVSFLLLAGDTKKTPIKWWNYIFDN